MDELGRYILDEMHLRMRTIEKMPTLALKHTFGKKRNGKRGKRGTSMKQWISNVEEIITLRVGRWSFPLSPNGKDVGSVKWDCKYLERLMACIDDILPIIMDGVEEVTRRKWEHAFELYVKVCRWLEKSEDFTDADILKFQFDVDSFIEYWIGLVGIEDLRTIFIF